MHNQVTFEAVDSSIAALQHSLSTLKGHRNTLTLVSRLPNELLSIIFLLVSAIYDQFNDTKWLWIPCLTGVCKRWREVVIACPKLWNRFPRFNLDFAKVVVERSKGTPLTLILVQPLPSSDLPDTPLYEMLEIAAPHMHRIQCMHLDDEKLGPGVMELFPKSAASLTALTLIGKSPLARPRARETDVVALPPDAFSNCPKLQALGLQFLSCNWTSDIFGANLVELTIEDIPRIARPSLIDFRGALERMPQLGSLTCQFALPAVNEVPVVGDAVWLRRLRRLGLSGTASEITAALLSIRHPPLDHLRITIDSSQDSQPPSRVFDILPHLSSRSRFWGANSSSIRTIFIEGIIARFKLHSCNFELYPEFIADWDEYGKSSGAPVNLSFTAKMSDYPQFLQIVESSIPTILPYIHSESLESVLVRSFPSTLQPLRSCSAIYNVCVRGPAPLYNMTAALRMSKSARNPSDAPFRGLRFLHIEKGIFEGDEEEEDDDEPVTDIKELQLWLSRRKKRGIGLEKLSFKECYWLDEEDIEVFKQKIPDVEWDGMVLDFSYQSSIWVPFDSSDSDSE